MIAVISCKDKPTQAASSSSVNRSRVFASAAQIGFIEMVAEFTWYCTTCVFEVKISVVK
jgi:hypothetical protein